MSALGSLVSKPANTALDKALKSAPASIDASLASAATAVSGSVEKAVVLFRDVYTSATTRIAGWIPTLRPWLLTQVTKLANKARAVVAGL